MVSAVRDFLYVLADSSAPGAVHVSAKSYHFKLWRKLSILAGNDWKQCGRCGIFEERGMDSAKKEQIITRWHCVYNKELSGLRFLLSFFSTLWALKYGICFYSIWTENMPEALNAIQSAMKEWESKTCIRFVKKTSQRDYLWFFRQKGWATQIILEQQVSHIQSNLVPAANQHYRT